MANYSTSTNSSASTSTPVVIQTPQSMFALTVAQAAEAVGNYEFQWALQQYQKTSVLTDQVVNQFLQAAQYGLGLAKTTMNQYDQTTVPEMNQLASEAGSYSGAGRQQFNMGAAESDAAQAANSARLNTIKNLQSFGVDPSSGMYAELENAANTQAGASEAAAGTQAEVNTQNTGRQLLEQSIAAGQQLPGDTVNALNSAFQGVAGAENAELSNANTGATLTGAAAPFFQAAMGLRYPQAAASQQSKSGGVSNGGGGQGNQNNKNGSGNGKYGASGGYGSQSALGGAGGARLNGTSPNAKVVNNPFASSSTGQQGAQGGAGNQVNSFFDSNPQAGDPFASTGGSLNASIGGDPFSPTGFNTDNSPQAQSFTGQSQANVADNPFTPPPNTDFGPEASNFLGTQGSSPFNPNSFGSSSPLGGGFNSTGIGNDFLGSSGFNSGNAGFNSSLGENSGFSGDAFGSFSGNNDYGGFGGDSFGSGSADTSGFSGDAFGSFDNGANGTNSYGNYNGGDNNYSGDAFGSFDSGSFNGGFGNMDAGASDNYYGGFGNTDYGGDFGSNYSGDAFGSFDTGGFGGGGYYAKGGGVLPRGNSGGPTTGGFVPRSASPSQGRQTDDIPARLNADEFVMPRDVVHWKGQEFFQKLIQQARKSRVTGAGGGAGGAPQGSQRSAQGQQKPALNGPPRFVSRPQGQQRPQQMGQRNAA